MIGALAPEGSEARHQAPLNAQLLHLFCRKQITWVIDLFLPAPNCIPISSDEGQNDDTSFSCLVQTRSLTCPGSRSTLKFHGILSSPLVPLGDGHLYPCKVKSCRYRKRKVPPWVSGGDGEWGPSRSLPGVQDSRSLWRLVLQSASECVLSTLQDSNPAPPAA